MTKTAGMVHGTPDWQLDRLFETDTAAELERQYAEEDLPISQVESQFDRAGYHIGQAVDHLIRAADAADPCGRAQIIDDLVNKLDDDFRSEMDKVLKQLKKGA